MHVLLFPVIEQQTAVGVVVQRRTLPAEQLREDIAAHRAQIAGDDQVIVLGRGAGVPKHRPQGVEGGGCHGRAHVGHVCYAHVHDLPPGGVGDIGPLRLDTQNAASGGGGCPLGGGAALAAVGQGRAVLPLGGAEVGGRLRRGDGGAAAGDGCGCQRQRLAHGGACAVHPVEGDVEIPQGEGGADILVQQVAGEHAVHVLRRQTALLQRQPQGVGLHLRLALLPRFPPAEGILRHRVKVAAQRPRALQPSRHRRAADDARRLQKPAGLAAQAFHVHIPCTSHTAFAA